MSSDTSSLLAIPQIPPVAEYVCLALADDCTIGVYLYSSDHKHVGDGLSALTDLKPESEERAAWPLTLSVLLRTHRVFVPRMPPPTELHPPAPAPAAVEADKRLIQTENLVQSVLFEFDFFPTRSSLNIFSGHTTSEKDGSEDCCCRLRNR